MNGELEKLADDYYDHFLRSDPTHAHLIGEYAYADRFDAVGHEAEAAMASEARSLAERADALDVAGLDDQERTSRSMLSWLARMHADMLGTRMSEFGADPIFGFQTAASVYVPKLGVPDAEVAEAMVAKYAGVAAYFHDLADRHREGLASGRAPAAFAVHETVRQLDAWLMTPVGRDPLLAVQDPPADVDGARWHERLLAVCQKQVRPALEHYRDVLRDEVAAHARPDEQVGLTWLPGGDEVYATAAAYWTTVDTSPAEIHDIGLRQVESLAEEYAALGPDVVGTDDVPEIFRRLRDQPALHHTDGARIVADSKDAMARAWQAMPGWFGRMPTSPCDVEATTSGPIAYYFPPPKDGSRGGVFFMNVSDPGGWGRFEIENTSFHEGIPGHHLQIAVASELDGLPAFRKHAFIGAYAEGWGLYTERLADEMGLYSTALDRMGMLAADSMRACRLVVDTGLHALGWSRRQAVDFMLAHSPQRPGPVAAEVDRYAVAPGQALSYMVGRLEIQRIRAQVETALGERFDVKAFHDAVLDSGALPLGLLGEVVRARLLQARRGATSACSSGSVGLGRT